MPSPSRALPYLPLRFPPRAPGLSGARPLPLSNPSPSLPRVFAFPWGLRTRLDLKLPFELT